MSPSFDIFCRVVDHYGDIGVCWRLARQLAAHPRCGRVRLWVDDLRSFARIAPGIRPDLASQQLSAVDIFHWHEPCNETPPADVVIEAFACTPPAAYLARLSPQQLWINLEYLSAEDWVESCHGLPSLQAGGLRKFFFFPGFAPRTGGLLREPALMSQRDAWQADPGARLALLRDLGVQAPWLERLEASAPLVYVYCYPQAPLASLVQALAAQHSHSLIVMPRGIWPHSLPAHPDGPVHVHQHDFVDQDRFDRLLWSSDLNVVRGEDSLTRALWAGRAMIWQPYLQEADSHLDKLQAWLSHSPYPADIRQAITAWNRADTGEALAALMPVLQPDRLHPWQALTHRWSNELAHGADLVTRLLNFHAKTSQTR